MTPSGFTSYATGKQVMYTPDVAITSETTWRILAPLIDEAEASYGPAVLALLAEKGWPPRQFAIGHVLTRFAQMIDRGDLIVRRDSGGAV